jgi:DNA uptake protein ComE-like DNA-binding protein
VNEATFEQLRSLGMSVTQATRVIAYRERKAGFDSIDDLDSVPGFPKKLRSELKDKLTA